jgi:acetyl esterase/lipase
VSQDTQRDQISKKRVVYTMPGMEAVPVRREEPYRVTDAGPLTMDVYYPPDAKAGARTPAVIFVTGFSDLGAEKMLGSRFKDMGSFVSWAQLVAVSGLVGITYANREPGDVHDVLHHVQQNAALLGIDGNRIGVWACSGHGPNALSVLMERGRDGLTCAVLAYAYTLDLDGSTRIADAAKQFRFVTTAADKSSNDLPRDLPLFVVRAGRDEMPGLNDALDRFVGAALAINLPVTVINHATGPHAFDLFDDTRTSRDIVKQMLAFLRFHLSA